MDHTTFKKENLLISIFSNRQIMGKEAAREAADKINELLQAVKQLNKEIKSIKEK